MHEKPTTPLIIAHRGSSAVAPENTVAAFSRALEDGTEGIEFDVRLTSDGVPVVFHDSTLKRIAGAEDRICELRSAELKTIDAGSWFNTAFPELARKRFAKERIPTLEETLDLLKDFTGWIYVELKSAADMAGLAKAVGEILARYSGKLKLIVKSFNFEAVPQVAAICPDIQTAALFAPNVMHILRKERKLISITREMKFDRLSLHYSLASRRLMEMAALERLPVTIWTVDSPHWVRKSLALGIDSLITNDPFAQLQERNGPR
ncbi:MAG: glycerophosphodiester phosphodiesterase family protein [Acidobacteriota bacterium]|nr:glycerophosphodiester phosphodiesterase family protein [Acidobacteriota bacterium]MDH3529542.1 glycerophosphodiester phosphodiesterase family protein [Acidobacteriota bacterium]